MADDVEIVAADPVIRRIFIAAVALVFSGLLLAYATIGDPVAWFYDQLFADIEALRAVDEEQARGRARDVLIGTVFGVWLSVLVVFGYLTIVSFRMWHASQWPHADARLVVDTKVIRGSALRARAALLIGCCFMSLAGTTYYAVEIVLWAQRQ